MLCVYFFALLVQALLVRELRRTMDKEGIETLELYPEEQECRAPCGDISFSRVCRR